MAPVTKNPRNQVYDADRKSTERSSRKFVIGGEEFRSAKRTTGVIRAWLESVPDDIADAEEGERLSKEDSLSRVGLINKQLAILLRPVPQDGVAADEESESSEDQVDKRTAHFDMHLDSEDAQQIMEILSPTEAEQKDAAKN